MLLRNIKIFKKVFRKVLTITCRNDNIYVSKGGGNMNNIMKILRRIKKALDPDQRKQEQRQANNKRQVKLILQGLDNRGW